MHDHTSLLVPGHQLTEKLDGLRNAVWLGRNETNRLVAVKLLSPVYEPVMPQRLGRRHRLTARVVGGGHGWVNPVDHGHTTDGRRYVVSPFFPAGSLADQVDGGTTPWFPACQLIARAAAIVARGHGAGWAFGHLKPTNILLNDDLDPRIIVYGTATRYFDDGNPIYLSPEVRDGQAPVPASDVYTLVLILASLLGGRAVDPTKPPADLVNDIAGLAPAAVTEIIDYGLAARLRNRFSDAGQLARALHTVLANADLRSRPAGSTADQRADPVDQEDRPDAPTAPQLDDPTLIFDSEPISGAAAGPLSDLLDGSIDGIDDDEPTLDRHSDVPDREQLEALVAMIDIPGNDDEGPDNGATSGRDT